MVASRKGRKKWGKEKETGAGGGKRKVGVVRRKTGNMGLFWDGGLPIGRAQIVCLQFLLRTLHRGLLIFGL